MSLKRFIKTQVLFGFFKSKENIIFFIGMFFIFICSFVSVYAANYLYDSAEVSYDNNISGITSDNVQGAIDELYQDANDYSQIREMIYPVGSIYISVEDDTVAKVQQRFGGTWEAFGAGRTLVGMGSNGTTNYTQVEKTDGTESQSYTPAGTNSGAAVTGGNITYTPAGTNSGGAVGNHTLTIAEMPSHSHGSRGYYATYVGVSGSGTGQVASRTAISGDPLDTKLLNTGGGGAHNHPFTQPKFTGTKATLTHTHTVTQPTFTGTAATISHMQPYITVYMYKRVS